MPIISVPKPLREKLGEDGSDALVAMLNEQGKETESSVIKTEELRFEKKLTEEISGVRVDLAESEKRFEKKLAEEVSGVRVDLAESEKRFEKKLTEEISGFREEMIRGDASLAETIQKSKTDTIKWMFIFWIGQIGALLGILFAVFK